MTLTDAEQLRSATAADDVALEMDEETFRAFYDRTARALWLYLCRVTASRQRADDLLQETYYRFLRAGSSYANDAHRRHALFCIATNLARDQRRRREPDLVPLSDEAHGFAGSDSSRVDPAERAERRSDLSRAMQRLRPRDRAMLWLAYAEGSSHREIAQAVGVRQGSVKLLLFRARRRLAALLGGGTGARS
jgi:RNA polymerase sigma-70 factor (ECF subfamily)